MQLADKIAGIIGVAIVLMIVFGLGQNTVAIINAIGGGISSVTSAATGGLQLTQQQASTF